MTRLSQWRKYLFQSQGAVYITSDDYVRPHASKPRESNIFGSFETKIIEYFGDLRKVRSGACIYTVATTYSEEGIRTIHAEKHGIADGSEVDEVAPSVESRVS
jgi:hypothetical protein